MPERRAVVAIAEGLHARPAALFVNLAAQQPVAVTIRKTGGEPVPASSILSVMGLGAGPGDEVILASDDAAAEPSLEALVQYLQTAD